MPVTLSIIAGPHAGQEIQVGEGQVFRIGRTERSDHPLPGDTYLSGAHFEIGCYAQECRVRDLGSSNGTLVNGALITETAVRNGDHIAAGETTFVVHVTQAEPEAVPSPPSPPPPGRVQAAPPERTERMYAHGFQPPPQVPPSPLMDAQERVRDILMRQAAPLFTVLDTARHPQILDLLLQSSPLNCQLVLDGETGDPPSAHSACVVEIQQNGSPAEQNRAQAFLETFLHFGWGKSWGIFLTSAASVGELCAHVRDFLLVRTNSQPAVYMRLYDPRILRALLPTCAPQDVSAIFGPIVSYLMESERSEMMLMFSRGSEGLVTTTLNILEKPMPAGAGGGA
ncbi:MAG: uncharacterized protein JWO48_1149 [Bryobacterales bacterium]|nr:uncharacterized protein [Bryobacterales bacterium]